MIISVCIGKEKNMLVQFSYHYNCLLKQITPLYLKNNVLSVSKGAIGLSYNSHICTENHLVNVFDKKGFTFNFFKEAIMDFSAWVAAVRSPLCSFLHHFYSIIIASYFASLN